MMLRAWFLVGVSALALGCGGGGSPLGPGPAASDTLGAESSMAPWRYRLQLAEGTGQSIAMTMWLTASDEPKVSTNIIPAC